MRNRRELQALDVLERFPCTSRAVARLTRMPSKSASSVLCKLYQLGAVTRTRIEFEGRSRPPYLYSIKSRFEPSISHPRDARGEPGPALYQEGV